MKVTEKSPKLFDYIAGAILTNGLAMIAIYLAAWELLFQYLLIPLWFLAAGIPSYLVCMRTTKNHLIAGLKTAVLSIIMGFFMVPTFQSLELGNLFIILICYIIGSVGGAYYSLRQQLNSKNKAIASTPNIEP